MDLTDREFIEKIFGNYILLKHIVRIGVYGPNSRRYYPKAPDTKQTYSFVISIINGGILRSISYVDKQKCEEDRNYLIELIERSNFNDR